MKKRGKTKNYYFQKIGLKNLKSIKTRANGFQRYFMVFLFIYLSIYLTLAKENIQYQYTVKKIAFRIKTKC